MLSKTAALQTNSELQTAATNYVNALFTADWPTMTTEVNNMSPNGNTNQAIGLQLGWMSLIGSGPFTAPAMQSGYTYSQIIILLTDGLNTQDRWCSV